SMQGEFSSNSRKLCVAISVISIHHSPKKLLMDFCTSEMVTPLPSRSTQLAAGFKPRNILIDDWTSAMETAPSKLQSPGLVMIFTAPFLPVISRETPVSSTAAGVLTKGIEVPGVAAALTGKATVTATPLPMGL